MIRTEIRSLPVTIGGFTVKTNDGWYTIVLNANLSYDRNMETYQHELSHIENGDFDSNKTVDEIENMRH